MEKKRNPLKGPQAPSRVTPAPAEPGTAPNEASTKEARLRPDQSRKPERPSAADASCKHCGCNFVFNITAAGDIHIHNHCAPPKSGGASGDAEGAEGYCRPPDGSCLPVVAGAKHKQGRAQKLAGRAARSRIPSLLAASTMHAIRRYVGGESPGNALEHELFAILAKMPKAFLRCTVDGFESIPPDQRVKVFAPLPAGTGPLDLNELATGFLQEIKQRAALAFSGDPLAAEGERPGRNRLYVPQGEDFTNQVRICRVNQLRTAHFTPPLQPGEYTPDEYQQDCTFTIINGEPTPPQCQLRVADCPGNTINLAACARVVDVAQGDSVELEGVNYFDVNAKVRLTLKDLSAPARDVDGFVWGDMDTPLEETVGTQTTTIRDCRVHDRLTFQAPDDLQAGLYTMQVVIPNSTGNPVFGVELVSNPEYLNVMPAPTARYQITIDKVTAREETSPTWAGSDEVGLRAFACAMDLNGELTGTIVTKFDELDGVEFDSGTHRDTNRLIFGHSVPILGLVIAVRGDEIDSERAYNQQLNEWQDYFFDLVERQKEFLLGLIGSGAAGSVLKEIGWKGFLYGLIAAGVVVAIDALVAIWGPADPIVEDLIVLSVIDLDRLVNPSTPVPLATSYASYVEHLRVNVIPVEKRPYEYTENREYRSAPELSRYELQYRYNRLA